MIDRRHALPVKRQAELVGISRGTVYYHPEPIGDADLRLMRRIDELHLELPFAGSRMLRDLLNGEGFEVGRRHVATLMRRMGIEALYRKPNTSKRHPRHRVFPYLLRGMTIDRANQVWAMDITYVPMARGFVFLTAVLDWHSRKVLAQRLSITMEAEFCVEALQEAIAKYGVPEIMNTDQGAQFTGAEFIGELRKHGIDISMDGRGQWRDNVFVERLWKSVKYEDVYLKAYESVSDARAGISRYIDSQLAPAAPRARRAHARCGVLRGAARDPASSMSVEHGLPTASVVRSSRATPARRRGQPCTETDQTAADPLISDRIVFKEAEPLLGSVSQLRYGTRLRHRNDAVELTWDV
jgi:putative transposase